MPCIYGDSHMHCLTCGGLVMDCACEEPHPDETEECTHCGYLTRDCQCRDKFNHEGCRCTDCQYAEAASELGR